MLGVTITILMLSLCYSYVKKENKVSCFTFFIAWEKTAIVVGTFLSWPTIIEKILDVYILKSISYFYK